MRIYEKSLIQDIKYVQNNNIEIQEFRDHLEQYKFIRMTQYEVFYDNFSPVISLNRELNFIMKIPYNTVQRDEQYVRVNN